MEKSRSRRIPTSDLAERLRIEAPRVSPPLLVALAGIPGSGKSTLARKLSSGIPDSVVIPMDGYHLPRAVLDEEGLARRGAPHTFDPEALRRDLLDLRHDRRGSFPAFDHANQDPDPGAIEVNESHRVILVEGLYLLLGDWNLAALFDRTAWIACDLDLAMARVERRHLESGICETDDEARTRVERNDRRNAELLLADGCPDRADWIVTTGGT